MNNNETCLGFAFDLANTKDAIRQQVKAFQLWPTWKISTGDTTLHLHVYVDTHIKRRTDSTIRLISSQIAVATRTRVVW